jgi:hypothetical protein
MLRAVLSASRLSSSRKRCKRLGKYIIRMFFSLVSALEAEEQMFQELVEQLRTVQETKTTALSEEQSAIPTSISPGDSNPFGSSSPDESISEGINDVFHERRRTTSLQPPRTYSQTTAGETMKSTATSTLVSLVNTLGFGRRKPSTAFYHTPRCLHGYQK